MCDIPSTAVFCIEYIECFPGIFPKYILDLQLHHMLTGFNLQTEDEIINLKNITVGFVVG
jgi:hypothetical protein